MERRWTRLYVRGCALKFILNIYLFFASQAVSKAISCFRTVLYTSCVTRPGFRCHTVDSDHAECRPITRTFVFTLHIIIIYFVQIA